MAGDDVVIDIVVDTDVLSFIFKNDTRAEAYRPMLAGKRAGISVQTAAELYRWAIERGWSRRRVQALEEALHALVTLDFDLTTARAWARIVAHRQRAGRPIATQDAWIAATAIRHNCPLLTHNARDYAQIAGLRVVSA
jgi:tRNA(fMet)-specific endonuclease VapC